VDATVSLIDMFPTLVELTGVQDSLFRDGTSLAPVLKNPAAAKDRDILLPGMKPEEYAVMNEDWRYIRYADGAEELYNTKQDPNEWNNLADNPEMETVKKQLRASAPRTFAEPGTLANELKLVVKGDTFAWKSKKRPAPKLLPDSVQGSLMIPRGNSDEAEMSSVDMEGRSAWTSRVRDGLPTYVYFTVNDPRFRNGKQPSVQVSITYLDQGNCPVTVQYDSSDEQANAAGTFKEATTFKVQQSGKWKTEVFNLEDAMFSGRANGGDLRLGFAAPDAVPAIAEVRVKPLR
jgi:hypothetical protein